MISTFTAEDVVKSVQQRVRKAIHMALQGEKSQVENEWEGLYNLRNQLAPKIVDEKTYHWRFRHHTPDYDEWEKALNYLNYYGGMQFQEDLMNLFNSAQWVADGKQQEEKLKRLIHLLKDVKLPSGYKVKPTFGGLMYMLEYKGSVMLYFNPSIVYDAVIYKEVYKSVRDSLSAIKEYQFSVKVPDEILEVFTTACDLRKQLN